ncbi:hypothetical protein NQD34_013719 [Periophthalmus magnuspinnatus]|nr:hypothetical protein NQD34_013719 [Periophthalmus magnuspinnatus]
MSHLQISVALLCLLSLTCAALDPRIIVQIKKDMTALNKEALDLAKTFLSSHDSTSALLDQSLKLVDLMDEMVHEYGIEQKNPSLAEFVEDLKTMLEDTKIFTTQQMKKKALLMKLLESTHKH